MAGLERCSADAATVAQTGSLLYRRLTTCERTIHRLPVGDTADKTVCATIPYCAVVVAQISNLLCRRQPVCERRYARRSLIAAKMSATTSAFGFAPRLPLPCRRTETFPVPLQRDHNRR